MIELHGWLTVRETYEAIEESEEILLQQIEKIKEEIENLTWFKPELAGQNGTFFVQFTLCHNRLPNFQNSEVYGFFKRVGEIAPGSYGLIYLYDDEAQGSKKNEFQVFVLRRGVVEQLSDTFLSPFIPKVENPWA